MLSTAKHFLLQQWRALPEEETLVFWEVELSVLLHLAFLLSSLAEILLQKVNASRSSTDPSTKNHYRGRIKLGISYRFSLLSCSLALATHLLGLLLIVKKSTPRVLLFEITQILSWSLVILKVVNFPRKKKIRVPRVLRIWWVFCFLQSGGAAIIDLYSFISMKRSPEAGEYTCPLTFLACSFLLYISIRGNTGISFSTGSISEPLLGRERNNHQSPYSRASFIQLLTFSWLNPLFSAGFRNPLELREVPDLGQTDSAEFLSLNLEKTLITGNSFYRGIFPFIRKKALMNAVLAVLNASASYVGPYLIDDLIQLLNGEMSHRERNGYVLSAVFLGAKIVETMAERQWIFGARQLGMRLRAALTSQIYKKGLLLSSISLQNHTSGEIINYMSVDLERISEFMWHLNIICMLPVQISLAIYVLQINLGLCSAAALAATGAVMACNFPIGKHMNRYQSKIMEAKDQRMKATAEILRNMKTLKLHSWDVKFQRKLERLRSVEREWLWKTFKLQAISALVFWGAPTFVSAVTFGACILMGIPLTAGRVLSALATFRMLQNPIFNVPDVLQATVQAKVSADRVASYLEQDEIKRDSVEILPNQDEEIALKITEGRFSWDAESKVSATLEEINLTVKKGMKVAICGTVGSGKSSLLSCVLGEIPRLEGKVKICGCKAYVPQTPWILTGSVRENILFGQALEEDKYGRVVKACALEKDFELFARGDLTEIGERGINVSGGQKQRIQIARAVYQDSDIYLLDDPFSAVDAHTGNHLFKECLMGILKDKTILYVTHEIQFLPAADLILVMKNGRISQAGRFEDLLRASVGFELLVGAHSEALGSVRAAKTSPQIEEEQSHPAEERRPRTRDPQNEGSLEREKILQAEERETGSIGRKVYWAYLTAVKGGIFIPIILASQSLFQALQVASNYWIAWASPPSLEIKPRTDTGTVFLVYVLLSSCGSLFVLLRAMLVAITGLRTSEKFFADMLQSVMRAPMKFFDSTPTGRILNRASTDQSVLDMEMAGRIGWCGFSVIQISASILVMTRVAWPVFAIFVPVAAIGVFYQRYYMPTARELARLAGIQRSPVLNHFAESLAGAAVIRAFDHGDRFKDSNLRLMDDYSRPWFHNTAAMEWLSFRLNLLSHFVFASSLVLLVSLPEGVISPSIAGLAVTYGLSLNVQQASLIWNWCNAENKMISVERILQYTRIESEGPLHVPGCKLPADWPQMGIISLKNLQVRYAEHLPCILKDITCTFPGKKKIGVVGRTGSGKSTLIQAIFRIVEPMAGSIMIDGIDIGKIGLHDLRSRLSIIPQDPTMFEGTVRSNLDPLEEYSDGQFWEVMEKCQLKDLVEKKGMHLDATVVENGENWSVGQRQLFCLGRALLKKRSILVLDEATASVDSATDTFMQRIIRQEFKDSTVITIAHRIHTIIDSDLVLVLSEGRVQEFDTPTRLLECPDTEFSRLIREYSLRSHSSEDLINQPDPSKWSSSPPST